MIFAISSNSMQEAIQYSIRIKRRHNNNIKVVLWFINADYNTIPIRYSCLFWNLMKNVRIAC